MSNNLVTFVIEVDDVASIVGRDVALVDRASSVDLSSFGFRRAHDRPERKQTALSVIDEIVRGQKYRAAICGSILDGVRFVLSIAIVSDRPLSVKVIARVND